MHRRRRFFPDGDQEQRPQQVRTTSSGGPPIFPGAPAAGATPGDRRRPSARRPPPRAPGSSPRHGQPQQVRSRSGSAPRTGSACIIGTPPRSAGPPEGRPPSGPRPGLDRERSGPSQDTRPRSGRPSAACIVSRSGRSAAGSAPGHVRQTPTRPAAAAEKGREKGKKGGKGAGIGTMDGWSGGPGTAPACISSRIGPGTVRRTAAGRAAGPPPAESGPGRAPPASGQAGFLRRRNRGAPPQSEGENGRKITIPICNLNSNLDFGFGFRIWISDLVDKLWITLPPYPYPIVIIGVCFNN